MLIPSPCAPAYCTLVGGGKRKEKIGKRGTQKQSSEEDGFASWEIWPCSYPKNCTHSTLRKTSFSRGDKIYGINSLVSERPESYEWKNWIFSIKRERKVQMQILQLKSVFHKFTLSRGLTNNFLCQPLLLALTFKKETLAPYFPLLILDYTSQVAVNFNRKISGIRS